MAPPAPWGPLPLAALARLSALSRAAILTYCALVAHAGTQGFGRSFEICDRSLQDLAGPISPETLRRARHELQTAGLLDVAQAPGFPPCYALYPVHKSGETCWSTPHARGGTPHTRGGTTPHSHGGGQEVLTLDVDVEKARPVVTARRRTAPVGRTRP